MDTHLDTRENPTMLATAAIEGLRARLRGPVLAPGDAEYDQARKVFNGMIDRHPAVIARCASPAEVIQAVEFGRAENLPVAIRGGGHNVAGNGVCDGGIVIDLSRMKAIRVDPVRRTVRAEPGLTWGEFDRETQAFGLATTGGLVSTTGIAGFTLGGGIGWLMRQHGLTVDNLLAADVVTADGRLVSASATDNPDLFWGLRGGGGNFGVVTSFEYRLHPVGPVLGGLLLYPIEKTAEFLRFYRDVVATAPDALTTLGICVTAPPAPFVPPPVQGTRVVGVAFGYVGRLEEGDAAIRPLRAFGPPLVEMVSPMPYVVLQSLFDQAAPFGMQNYWKSAQLDQLTDAAIDVIAEHAAALPLGLSAVHLHHLGGAVRRVDPSATAFAPRDAEFTLNLVGIWPDPADNARNVAWVRAFFDAVHPHARGAYVNFLGHDEGEDRVRAAYGLNYDRLVAFKTTYDPTNLFRLNHNLRPKS